jgi:DNA polymerase elongation subunit (family B)
MIDLDKKIKTLSLKQGAIKILINSIYGAFGNKWFYFYNPDIAQSITLQGQDLIKFSIKAINFYFKERWHLDTELHQILGVADRIISKIED